MPKGGVALRWVLLFFLLLPAWAQGQARFGFALGEVEVLRGGRTLSGEIGMELSREDRVRTGADGTAVIELENGSQLKLRENTLINLETIAGDVQVELQEGSLFSRVERLAGRGYRVRTGAVVAGVRGTEFFVAFGRTIEDAADVWLCVNEGAVEVTVEGAREPVTVREGEGINILSGSRITEPRFYPWTEGLNWNMDPEDGEVRDDTDLDQAYSDLLDQDYD